MDIIFNIIAAALLAVTSLFGGGDVAASQQLATAQNTSVEIGIVNELSPNGEAGGFAMPASGCGVIHDGLPEHDCDTSLPIITTNLTIVRAGDPVVVSWDPNGNVDCSLSANIEDAVDAGNPTLETGRVDPDGNVPDSAETFPTGETIYSIICTDGGGREASVSVKVLPEIQET